MLLDELLLANVENGGKSNNNGSDLEGSGEGIKSGSNSNSVGVVYEQIVEYLTGNVDPEAFLNLLPGRGHLLYFLPYLFNPPLNPVLLLTPSDCFEDISRRYFAVTKQRRLREILPNLSLWI